MPRVVLPRPLEHQLPVLSSPARHKLCCMGRKWGKTLMGLIMVVDGHGPGGKWRGAARGAQGLWAAPTAQTAADIWRDLKASTREAWVDKSEVERRITLPGGGSVTVRSADNPDSLRGPNYNFVVLDETAFCHEDAWGLVLRPTLAATGGWSMQISTPAGHNWWWKHYEQVKDDPDCERWQRPTSDNPKVPASELVALRRDLGSYKFSQEHLAEFVTPAGNMFRREFAVYYSADDLKNANVVDYFLTVDTGCSAKDNSDLTSIACWAITMGGKLVLIDLDMRRLEAPAIAAAIVAMSERHHDALPWIESTTQSKHLLAFLAAEGVVFRELEPGAKDKVHRASWAQGLWEQQRVALPKDAAWLDPAEQQLFAFPTKNVHDDFVDCLAWAAWIMKNALGSSMPTFTGVFREREILPLGMGSLKRIEG